MPFADWNELGSISAARHLCGFVFVLNPSQKWSLAPRASELDKEFELRFVFDFTSNDPDLAGLARKTIEAGGQRQSWSGRTCVFSVQPQCDRGAGIYFKLY